MGRLLVVVSIASLVVMSAAAAWMAWRAGASLPLRRRAAFAALAGVLAVAPGSALGWVFWRVGASLRRAAPRTWDAAAWSVAEEAGGALLESGAPSCAR